MITISYAKTCANMRKERFPRNRRRFVHGNAKQNGPQRLVRNEHEAKKTPSDRRRRMSSSRLRLRSWRTLSWHRGTQNAVISRTPVSVGRNCLGTVSVHFVLNMFKHR